EFGADPLEDAWCADQQRGYPQRVVGQRGACGDRVVALEERPRFVGERGKRVGGAERVERHTRYSASQGSAIWITPTDTMSTSDAASPTPWNTSWSPGMRMICPPLNSSVPAWVNAVSWFCGP